MVATCSHLTYHRRRFVASRSSTRIGDSWTVLRPSTIVAASSRWYRQTSTTLHWSSRQWMQRHQPDTCSDCAHPLARKACQHLYTCGRRLSTFGSTSSLTSQCHATERFPWWYSRGQFSPSQRPLGSGQRLDNPIPHQRQNDSPVDTGKTFSGIHWTAWRRSLQTIPERLQLPPTLMTCGGPSPVLVPPLPLMQASAAVEIGI